ncbi:TetR/AcrR family transcriptional regulator [Moritella sp.]|uniref:acrylate utilization transcriptional regulator AcuR n=1 Tax=Moritella sp. TaxID=78556 RepID=UPI001DA9A4A2|nr:TetR/AcrR family transcriptional regulator [Moritella sp.]MCJ8350259.1 TetR/AcrR family transcriptional regulator [Moritella sp.]NQZ40704.1 TetR family transcriptional regulator C-terminal domain-containing protein [Moritella sp.]
MTSNQPKPRRGRPPKIARENSDTRALLIRSGVEVLTESGFAAAGIDSILKKVGVPKGSFYHYFKSKEDFGQAVIDNYASYFAAKLDKYLLDESIAPLQRIVKFADGAKRGIVKFEFKRGCLVGNLGQEVAILPDSYRLILQNIFAVWQTKMQACLETAQQQGDIKQNINCIQQAEYFWTGWEGAVMRARLVQSVQPLDLYISTFIASIASN